MASMAQQGKKSGSIQKPDQTKPGDGVSVDQIISAQPGLIPQMAGFLTSKWIQGCTTIVDHVSNYIYVYLGLNTTGNIIGRDGIWKNYAPEPTNQLNIVIMQILVNSPTQHSLPPAIISTKQLIVELAHTIKAESLEIEINSSHKELEFFCYMAWECGHR